MSAMWAAVDLGATSGRVLTGGISGGRLHTEEVARFTNQPVVVPVDGRDELQWDILALWSGVRGGLAAAGRLGPVSSVGVDTWAVDYGFLDADGALLGNPVHYRDERTGGAPDRFFSAMSAAEHYAITGAQVQPFNTVFQLLAASGSARRASARRLLLVPDLISHWLGGRPTTEITNASTTGLLDVRSRTWSEAALCALYGVAGTESRSLLPELVEPGTDLGEVRPSLGVPGSRVVAVGSHDTASAVAAVPMSNPSHAAYISSGTWSLVGVELDDPVLTEASRTANVTNELGVAGTVRYLKNIAGLWLLSESQRQWQAHGEDTDLATLVSAAAAVPACRTVIDVNDPSFVRPGNMPQRIADAARASGQPVPVDPAAVTRCILDSLALAYRRTVRELAQLADRDIHVVHVVGGGSRNDLLCQLTADATGLPVVAGPAEGTAMGNLLVQAWADGTLPGGLPAIREVVAASTTLSRFVPTGRASAWDAAETRLPR